MNLRDLQTDFQRILASPRCISANWVNEPARGLSSQGRLAIYHNAYRVRLIDVLLDTFEHTASYLGDDWFRRLAANYVQSHPSLHHNIGWYGREFPRFLAEQLAHDGEVAELASMDWELRRAFDGGESDVMTHKDLQRLASRESRINALQAVPTLSISMHHFNSLAIWRAINEDEQPPLAERLQEPVEIMVWRKGHAPHFRSLSKIESAAISCVCSGQHLEAIGAAPQKDFPDVDVATEFGLMLRRWLDDQLLTMIR